MPARKARTRPPNATLPPDFVPYALPHPERYPFEQDLAPLVAPGALRSVLAARRYACYLLADVGGITDPRPQRTVAAAMCALEGRAERYDQEGAPCGETMFAYIAGDVVYDHGQRRFYRDQFYEPYRRYRRPILAIPGNHDGETDGGAQRSLDGFIANFCSAAPALAEQDGDFRRAPLDLPNVYWTLEAPWLRIIGLYSNVPEGGAIEDQQRRWFLEQLARPCRDKHLIVALHQPIFSVGTAHSGSPELLELIHEPARQAGCRLVVSGHVHNYQRFAHGGVAYVVNGAGGYHALHGLLPPEDAPSPGPLAAHAGEHSFIQLTVTPERLLARAIAVPLGTDFAFDRPKVIDRFAIER